MRRPAPFLDHTVAVLEREIVQARKMLKRLEALASDDLRLGFSANHVRGLVAEYRASVRALLDRRDDLVSRDYAPRAWEAPTARVDTTLAGNN